MYQLKYLEKDIVTWVLIQTFQSIIFRYFLSVFYFAKHVSNFTLIEYTKNLHFNQFIQIIDFVSCSLINASVMVPFIPYGVTY